MTCPSHVHHTLTDHTLHNPQLPFTVLPHLSHTITPSQFVASGSRVKLYLPKDTCLITFILAGRSCFHDNVTTTIVSMTTIVSWQQPCLHDNHHLYGNNHYLQGSIPLPPFSNGNIPLPCFHGNMLLPQVSAVHVLPDKQKTHHQENHMGKKLCTLQRNLLCTERYAPPSHHHTLTFSHLITSLPHASRACILTVTPN